jgi:hypothetical protein
MVGKEGRMGPCGWSSGRRRLNPASSDAPKPEKALMESWVSYPKWPKKGYRGAG